MDEENSRPKNNTLVTLRDYFERLLQEHRERNDAQFAAMDKALEIAARTTETRLAGMNEFRESLRDQTARFVTDDKVDLMVRQLREGLTDNRDEIRLLQLKQSNLDGRLAAYAAGLAILLTVLALVLKFFT